MVVDGQTLTATVNGNTWSVAVPTAPADRTYDVQAAARDQAGNQGTDVTNDELIVDTAPPTVTVDALATNGCQPRLTGTVGDPVPSSGIASVTVMVGGQTLTATVSGETWSADVFTARLAGTYDVQATVADKAGNSVSDATTDELVIIESVPPTVTVTPLTTNHNQPVLSGSVAPRGPAAESLGSRWSWAGKP